MSFRRFCSLCDCDKSPNRVVFEKYVVSIFPSQDHPQHPPIHRARYDRDTRRRDKVVSYGGRLQSCSQDSRDVISARRIYRFDTKHRLNKTRSVYKLKLINRKNATY